MLSAEPYVNDYDDGDDDDNFTMTMTRVIANATDNNNQCD